MTSVDQVAEFIAALDLGEGVAGLIDGELVRSAGEAIDTEDPATGQPLVTTTEADDALVDRAVRSGAEAFRAWSRTRPSDRGRTMHQVAGLLREHADLLADLESIDTGKPISQARSDVETSARYFEFYAGVADKNHGETIPTRADELVYTVREPYGVVAHVTPWNSPLSQLCRGAAPSLACGNAVVVKPSEVTPLSTVVFARLLDQSGLMPRNTITVVLGRGPVTGAAVVEHPLVAHIAFTGSVPTGTAIMTMAAQRMVGCNLELGGKSPTIVLADADLAKAARAGAAAAIRNSGQSCFATTRMLVDSSKYDEFVERCAAEMSGLTVGAGLTDPDLGPLSSGPHLTKVRGMVEQAVAEGAQVAAGGTDVEIAPRGHFHAPTLLAGVNNAMTVAQNEVFGPVQTAIPFDDVDEAISIANDSRYGLAAGIFTNDLTSAHAIAGRLEAGQVQINRYPAGDVSTPFGGYKASGIGREKGVEAMHHYSQLKTVIIDLPEQRWRGASA